MRSLYSDCQLKLRIAPASNHSKQIVILLLLVLCRAAFTPHYRTLEVRPGRISKTLELDYDYDVKGLIRRGRCEGDDTKGKM